ncbi:hypothetical protein TKK_0001712 [Trichogramma kaykai]
MEEKFKERNVGGVKIGNNRIWSLAYAEDVERQLIVSVEKRKVLVFNKERNQKLKKWLWNEGYLEEVREFEYIGMILNDEGNFNSHIEKLVKKEILAAKCTWDLGERRCKEDFRRRMLLFNYLMQSVMSYGAELWGWKEWRKLEKVQMDYIRWILGIDFCTPRYIIVRETGRIKMQRKWTKKRAIKFERLCAMAEEGRLVKQVWEQQGEEGLDEERREALGKLGLSDRYIQVAIRYGRKVEEVERRMVDIIKQETDTAVDNARYNREFAERKCMEITKYLRTYEKGIDIRTVARISCGNFEENKFWKKNERKCALCGVADSSLLHLSNECKETRIYRSSGNVKKWKMEEIINPEGDRTVVRMFKKIDIMMRNSKGEKEEETETGNEI